MPRGIKRLGYRAQVGVTQPGQAAHWDGFTFTGGPWQVIYRGPWGSWQVWASSGEEGRRVIEHACSAAGVDPNDKEGQWAYNRSSSPRHQRIATYRTAKKFGLPVVTVRDGPSGPALIEPP
jgi:hypothetical protein